jgi:transcriptional regulator with XRE-family HTH domain
MSTNLAREKLRAYKAEHGLTLRGLGDLLDVSGANVEALLRTRQMPRVGLALRIQRVCDIPTSDWGVETAGPETTT